MMMGLFRYLGALSDGEKELRKSYNTPKTVLRTRMMLMLIVTPAVKSNLNPTQSHFPRSMIMWKTTLARRRSLKNDLHGLPGSKATTRE